MFVKRRNASRDRKKKTSKQRVCPMCDPVRLSLSPSHSRLYRHFDVYLQMLISRIDRRSTNEDFLRFKMKFFPSRKRRPSRENLLVRRSTHQCSWRGMHRSRARLCQRNERRDGRRRRRRNQKNSNVLLSLIRAVLSLIASFFNE